MIRRFVVPAVAGLILGFTLCAGLILADEAGAQETTTTTEAPTTTTTTTTTAPPPPPPAEPTVDDTNPIGSRETLQWLALIVAFTCGHVLTR